MISATRVCLYGLGAIGAAVARALMETPGVEIVSAIDTDPDKVGRDARSILRLKGESGVRVAGDAAEGLRTGAPQVVVHCTGSRLRGVAGQLEQIVDAGLPCVTSCEEMAFPEVADAALAASLDRRARERGVALLGAGVNPGFVMDGLVLALSGATRAITHLSVERVLDPLSRRKAFQRKVGLGMTYAAAARELEQGRFGHVGLRESAMLVARGLGWDVSALSEDVRILCEDSAVSRSIRSRKPPHADAPVVGLQQTLVARVGSEERIRMEMVMAAGVEGPHDAITIHGEPDLNLWIQGGVPGDQATVACLVNGMAQILAPPRPGLLTLLDLPLRPARRDS